MHSPRQRQKHPRFGSSWPRTYQWIVEKVWKKNRMGIHLGEHRGDSHQTCSHLWEDNNWVMCGTKKNSCKHMMTYVIEEGEHMGTWS